MLGIDRTGSVDMKESLVDTLLDFLGEPNEDYQNPHGYIEERRNSAKKKKTDSNNNKKQAGRTSNRRGAKTAGPPPGTDGEGSNDNADQMDEDDDDDDDRPLMKASAKDKAYDDVDDVRIADATGPGTMPSDDMLRRWVRAYVRCHNMKKATMRNAMDVASVKFGVDMSERKNDIRELLVEEL